MLSFIDEFFSGFVVCQKFIWIYKSVTVVLHCFYIYVSSMKAVGVQFIYEMLSFFIRDNVLKTKILNIMASIVY